MTVIDDIAADLSVVPGSIGAALIEGEQRLHYADVIRPRRHTELLLEEVLNADRTELYLRTCDQMSRSQSDRFQSLLMRREAHEPVQYIVGWAPFYGRRFHINEGVFIPRFETEILIERFLEALAEDRPKGHTIEILDLCCGSGVIGLTVAAEVVRTRVTMIDISEAAVECSRHNARELKVESSVNISRMDALEYPPLEWCGRFRYILANPPYIPTDELDDLPRDVREGEPHEALTDGNDGLTFYRRWMKTLPPVTTPGGRLIVECGDCAAESVVTIMSEAFRNISITKDLGGMERLVDGIRM